MFAEILVLLQGISWYIEIHLMKEEKIWLKKRYREAIISAFH